MLNLIPAPKSCILYGGDVALERQPKIHCAEGTEFCEQIARKLFQNVCPALKPDSENARVCVSFATDCSLGEEAYTIECNDDAIKVTAGSRKGLVYAMVTLRQIMKADDEQKPFLLSFPCCRIEDSPRFAYRGFMLDEARNFIGEDGVKKIIELMCFYKLNVLHWHLSDDQGYRIESKIFPMLNKTASFRNDTQVGGFGSDKFAGCRHGGYYTQAQIKQIVSLAASKAIDVQPEINFPGHMSALIAAFPELSCTKEAHSVPTTFGTFSGAICAGNEDAWEKIFALFDEICSLFPSDTIHIGGDPFDFEDWKNCALCKDAMRKHNLKDEKQLVVFALNKAIDYLCSKGKKVVVRTSEHMEGIDERAIIHLFKNASQSTLEHLVRKGTKFIISPCHTHSFDLPYVMSPLKALYNCGPLSCLPSDAKEENVLGTEGLLWGEWVYDMQKVEFNCFPRLCALAEQGWSTAQNRNFDSFKKRWQENRKILAPVNVNWACDKLANAKTFFKGKQIFLWKTTDQYGEVRKNKQ